MSVSFENYYEPWNKWLEVDAHPTDAGALAVYYRDVTEGKRAAEAVRESEERFRLLADTIPNLEWMVRPDGHILWYNRRWYEYTGTTPDEMAGWGWQGVHDPEVLPRVLDRWRASVASGEPFSMVFPLKGGRRHVPPVPGGKARVHWHGVRPQAAA